jgi:DNA-binding MarR family transcriptional regulator
MQFESLILRINEILHKSIQKYKQEIVGNEVYPDISLSQLYYIEAVHHLGNPTISELAAYLNVSKASTSESVRKLIAKGLFIKVQSSEDKRIYNVGLSELGLKLMEAEANALSGFIQTLKSSLDENELHSLETIFSKILKNYPDKSTIS